MRLKLSKLRCYETGNYWFKGTFSCFRWFISRCSECLLEVGSLFSLKRHCKMIHDPKRLTCADCGAKFRKKHCYNEHLSMHAGISMYKCEVCQVECPTLRLLKKHQLSHEKKKTYACKASGCTKVFDKWSKLAKHVETDHQFGKFTYHFCLSNLQEFVTFTN